MGNLRQNNLEPLQAVNAKSKSSKVSMMKDCLTCPCFCRNTTLGGIQNFDTKDLVHCFHCCVKGMLMHIVHACYATCLETFALDISLAIGNTKYH
jgi:hypothetical protein